MRFIEGDHAVEVLAYPIDDALHIRELLVCLPVGRAFLPRSG